MRRPEQTELMGLAFKRFCARGRGRALLGASESLVMDAYASLSPSGVAPSLYLEMPLLGEACCDVGVGPYRKRGSFTLTDEFANGDARSFEIVRWLPRLGGQQDVFFGVDLDPQRDVPVSGAYVRHFGDLDVAREFYGITGSVAGFEGFRRASERLPEGWLAVFAADYFGRDNSPLRLEAMLAPDVLGAVASDAGALRDGLGSMGVPFVDDEMISLCQGLFRLGKSASFQFDVYPDGSLAGLLSATLFFSPPVQQESPPDEKRRTVQRSMSYLREAGMSDERCQLLDEAAFAQGVPGIDDEGLLFDLALLCEPYCCKLKWVDGVLRPARWYQILRASVSPATGGRRVKP